MRKEKTEQFERLAAAAERFTVHAGRDVLSCVRRDEDSMGEASVSLRISRVAFLTEGTAAAFAALAKYADALAMTDGQKSITMTFLVKEK